VDSWLILLLLFSMSAFFSGSEVSFFSISKIKQKELERISPRLKRMYSNQNRLLIAILICNTLVNVLIASYSTIFALKFADSLVKTEIVIIVEILLVWILLLVFGEILPKVISFAHSEFITKFASFILEPIIFLLYPIIILIEGLSKLFTKKADYSVTLGDFQNVIYSNKNSLNDKEQKLITNIFRFPNTKITQIMIPRVDIKGFNIDGELQELKNLIKKTGFSRIPIFKGNFDEIVGFIYAKDIILLKSKNTNVKELLRKPIFLTQNTRIPNVLTLFKKQKTHIAVVVDEYGGTCGIVTLEDILEELVGEIQDEKDLEISPIIKIAKNKYNISAMCNIPFLNQEFCLDIPVDNYDNIAEFIYDKFDKVPFEGEKFVYQNVTFTVNKIDANRIKNIILEIKDENL